MRTYTFYFHDRYRGMHINPMLKKSGLKMKENTMDELETFVKSNVLQADTTEECLYIIDEIIYSNIVYNFTVPLWCNLIKEEDCMTIESEMLDIKAKGKSLEEAREIFFKEFDYIYTLYNKIPNEKATYKIARIKNFFNSNVIKS